MKKKVEHHSRNRFRASETTGFSLIELLVAVTIMLVIAAVALPTIDRAIRTYRLNAATINVANVLQTARFEAIRVNRNNPPVTFRFITSGGRTTVWVDSNNNGAVDTTEIQYVLPNDVQFVSAASAPTVSSMGYAATQVPAGPIVFDARGTLNYAGSPQVVYVLLLGYPSRSELGFCAVAVTPMARTQVWSAPAGGPWIRR